MVLNAAQSYSDWLFITQSGELLVDWLVLENNFTH